MKRGNDQSDLAGIRLEWGPTRDINLEGANLYMGKQRLSPVRRLKRTKGCLRTEFQDKIKKP